MGLLPVLWLLVTCSDLGPPPGVVSAHNQASGGESSLLNFVEVMTRFAFLSWRIESRSTGDLQPGRSTKPGDKHAARNATISAQCWRSFQHLRSLPWFTPSTVPIDLFFFRRIFSRLYSQHGDSQGEVPVSVFQRSVVRLFRLMKMDRQADDFSADEYDVDGSGAVGWYEFVTDVSVKLSLPERFFVLMEEPTSSLAGVLVGNLTL
eukprot:Skav223087  [mRNA]  locus=scaffold419:294122:300299:+ [translate_table: standard]